MKFESLMKTLFLLVSCDIKVLITFGKSFLWTTKSIWPFSCKYSAVWNSGGSSSLTVSLITRAPANAISAFGSAILMSPRRAIDAVVPPVVGSRQTEIKGSFYCFN